MVKPTARPLSKVSPPRGGGGLVEARSSVRDRLRLQRTEEDGGRIDRFTTMADAVEAFETGSGSEKNG